MDEKTIILKVLVGSRAHGLQTEESDHDYRGVYVLPTKKILSLGFKYKGSEWLEGEAEDQTAWEIGHFLQLATKCNPTILEVFKAPVVYEGYNTSMGWYIELRNLFPYIWNPNDAFNAFIGYGLNQRKKMLENKDKRAPKYATAYIRTLYNLIALLRHGDFSLEITDPLQKDMLLEIKNDKWTTGDVIDLATNLSEQAQTAKDTCKHTPNLEKVNEFLLTIRQEFWG